MWSLADIARITQGVLSVAAHPETRIADLVIDSGAVTPGSLFVALPGAKVDGHAFLQDAFERGAVAALVQHAPENPAWPVIQVENTDVALWAIGAAAVARHTGIRIGITGSAGKTTTKDMLASALESATEQPVFKTNKSYNSLRGLPTTLANLPADAPYAVIEIGMNQPGEIRRLTQLLKPHAVLLTCITEAHIEAFEGSREKLALEKISIIEGLVSKTGPVVIPDQPEILKIEATRFGLQNIHTFGETPGNDTHLIAYDSNGQTSQISAKVEGAPVQYTLPAPGRHLARNSLAVLEMVHRLGLPLDKAAVGLANSALPAGRGQVYARLYHGIPFTLIDESYNGHPSSVRATLEVLLERPLPAGAKRIVVLSEMRELGPEAPALHAGLATALPPESVACVITVCPMMRHLHDAVAPAQRTAHLETIEEVLPILMPLIRPGDQVFLKGTRGTRLWTLIPEILQQTEAAQAQESSHAIHPAV